MDHSSSGSGSRISRSRKRQKTSPDKEPEICIKKPRRSSRLANRTSPVNENKLKKKAGNVVRKSRGINAVKQCYDEDGDVVMIADSNTASVSEQSTSKSSCLPSTSSTKPRDKHPLNKSSSAENRKRQPRTLESSAKRELKTLTSTSSSKPKNQHPNKPNSTESRRRQSRTLKSNSPANIELKTKASTSTSCSKPNDSHPQNKPSSETHRRQSETLKSNSSAKRESKINASTSTSGSKTNDSHPQNKSSSETHRRQSETVKSNSYASTSASGSQPKDHHLQNKPSSESRKRQSRTIKSSPPTKRELKRKSTTSPSPECKIAKITNDTHETKTKSVRASKNNKFNAKPNKNSKPSNSNQDNTVRIKRVYNIVSDDADPSDVHQITPTNSGVRIDVQSSEEDLLIADTEVIEWDTSVKDYTIPGLVWPDDALKALGLYKEGTDPDKSLPQAPVAKTAVNTVVGGESLDHKAIADTPVIKEPLPTAAPSHKVATDTIEKPLLKLINTVVDNTVIETSLPKTNNAKSDPKTTGHKAAVGTADIEKRLSKAHCNNTHNDVGTTTATAHEDNGGAKSDTKSKYVSIAKKTHEGNDTVKSRDNTPSDIRKPTATCAHSNNGEAPDCDRKNDEAAADNDPNDDKIYNNDADDDASDVTDDDDSDSDDDDDVEGYFINDSLSCSSSEYDLPGHSIMYMKLTEDGLMPPTFNESNLDSTSCSKASLSEPCLQTLEEPEASSENVSGVYRIMPPAFNESNLDSPNCSKASLSEPCLQTLEEPAASSDSVSGVYRIMPPTLNESNLDLPSCSKASLSEPCLQTLEEPAASSDSVSGVYHLSIPLIENTIVNHLNKTEKLPEVNISDFLAEEQKKRYDTESSLFKPVNNKRKHRGSLPPSKTINQLHETRKLPEVNISDILAEEQRKRHDAESALFETINNKSEQQHDSLPPSKTINQLHETRKLPAVNISDFLAEEQRKRSDAESTLYETINHRREQHSGHRSRYTRLKSSEMSFVSDGGPHFTIIGNVFEDLLNEDE